jgi:hypothetical protein
MTRSQSLYRLRYRVDFSRHTACIRSDTNCHPSYHFLSERIVLYMFRAYNTIIRGHDLLKENFKIRMCKTDSLCGPVVRVPGYRSRGPGSDSRRYQIFWEAVGLERGPLSLVRITEELGRVATPGLENRDLLRWPRDTLYSQNLTLTSSTSGGRSVSIIRLRTKATEFYV